MSTNPDLPATHVAVTVFFARIVPVEIGKKLDHEQEWLGFARENR
jgi:hypothetical protein